MRINWFYFLKTSFPPSFCKKSENFHNLEKLQSLMKDEYFLEKKAYILSKGIFDKTGGRKICHWELSVFLKLVLCLPGFKP